MSAARYSVYADSPALAGVVSRTIGKAAPHTPRASTRGTRVRGYRTTSPGFSVTALPETDVARVAVTFDAGTRDQTFGDRDEVLARQRARTERLREVLLGVARPGWVVGEIEDTAIGGYAWFVVEAPQGWR